MTIKAFTVSSAAKELGISPSTLRRWCKEHSVYLSVEANPAKGGERRLSPIDMEVFREVSRLRGEGQSPAAVNERLVDMVFSAGD